MSRLIGLLLSVVVLLPACQPVLEKAAKQEILAGARKVGERAPVTPQELAAITAAFADRYVLLITNACDRIKSTSPDPVERQRAHELKTVSATSIYDIVTNPDPYTQLLDLTVAVTLQSVSYIDEDYAEKLFGAERSKILVAAVRKARLEIWEICARTLSDEQMDNLDFMIWDYRRQNPDILGVINVRFNDFAGSRGKSLVGDSKATGLLAPIDDARKSVDEARMLAERSFYYFKRAPLLVAWRAEAAIDDVLVKPEVRNVLRSIDDASSAANRAASALDKLPDAAASERKAILAAIDERQGKLSDLMKEVRTTLADADKVNKSGKELLVEVQHAATSVGDLIKNADTIAGHYVPHQNPQPKKEEPKDGARAPQAAPAQVVLAAPPAQAASAPPPGPPQASPPPFDIRDYTKALVELATAAKELDKVVVNSHELIQTDAWKKRIEEINASADTNVKLATNESRSLVDSIFIRVYIAIGLLFVALVLARVVSHRILSARKKGAVA